MQDLLGDKACVKVSVKDAESVRKSYRLNTWKFVCLSAGIIADNKKK